MMKPFFFFIKNQTFFNLHLKLWVKSPCSRHVHVNYLVIRNNLRDINLSDTIMILYDLLSDHNVHQGAWHCVAVKHVFSKWNVLQDTQQSIVQYLPYEIGAHVFHSRTHNSTNLWSVNKISQGTWINHSPFFYFNHLYFLNTSSLYYDNHKGAYISWFQTFKVFQPLFFTSLKWWKIVS